MPAIRLTSTAVVLGEKHDRIIGCDTRAGRHLLAFRIIQLGALADQERRCREYIAEQLPGCAVADDCVFQDSGASGLAVSRPGLEALLKKVGDTPQPFSHLIVEAPDRFGRSLPIVFPILDVLHYREV